MKKENAQCIKEKQKLQAEVMESAGYIDNMEHKVYEANKTSLNLL